MDRSLSWIGSFPPAVDLANTIIDSPRGALDLLETDADLDAWIAAERPNLPAAGAAAGHLDDVRTLRDSAREILFARSEGRPIGRKALQVVNRAAAEVPVHPHLRPDGSRETVETASSDYARFAAGIARSLIELVTGADLGRLSTCKAPSCGMFFLRDDPRQRWCSSSCGTRARVARHARRHRRT